MTISCAAILVAGGRASRMGGIDKPGLLVDGVSMRDRAIAAVHEAGASPIVVVGPESASPTAADAGVRWIREDPPFTGPAAAVIAGLTAIDHGPEWIFLLACDLPRVAAAAERLLQGIRDLPPEAEGLCLADADDRPQWLTGLYRASALRREAATRGDGRDQPVRALIAGLAPMRLTGADSARDVDTWQDYEQLTKEHP